MLLGKTITLHETVERLVGAVNQCQQFVKCDFDITQSVDERAAIFRF